MTQRLEGSTWLPSSEGGRVKLAVDSFRYVIMLCYDMLCDSDVSDIEVEMSRSE